MPIVLPAVACFLALASVAPQSAVVTGTVRSAESGQPLQGASVVLTDLGAAATTDVAGRYVLRDVPAGPQHVSVRYLGYAPHAVHVIVPREGDMELDVGLQPLPFRLPAVTVRHSRGATATGSTEGALPNGEVLTAYDLARHPLAGDRDVFAVLARGSVVARTETPGGLFVHGGSSDQTGYTIDGVPVHNPYHLGGLLSAFNPDVIGTAGLAAVNDAGAGPLSATLQVTTRTPGSRVETRGGVSSSSLRFAADGPTGIAGATFLLSARVGLPGVLRPHDPALLHGETGDWLVKVERPTAGGQLRAIGFASADEAEAAPVGGADTLPAISRRNAFQWRSRSLGLQWDRPVRDGTLRFSGWNSFTDAGASIGVSDVASLTADRQDRGVQAVFERHNAPDATTVGVRLEHTSTAYHAAAGDTTPATLALGAAAPVTTLFAAREQELGATLGVHGGAALQVWNARGFVSPHVQVTWAPVPALVVTAAAKRGHQFVQSLRNPESVVGHVFPVDLFVGSSQNGIPVARSDEVSLTARLRPAPGWRIGAAAYARRMDGLVLVAPFEAGTFAQSDVGTGKGTAQGASVDAEVQSGRYMATASYGWQAVRYRYQGGAYIPEHGARHQVATGVTLFPSASSSIRLSALAAAGRRATGVVGSIDWEPCNILDRGCEFAGSPRIDPQALGASTVPRYARVDLSARKHWHVRTLDHDAELALFGTVTNVFNRHNVLTFVRNSGALTPLEMRPRAPLVVGLDWRF